MSTRAARRRKLRTRDKSPADDAARWTAGHVVTVLAEQEQCLVLQFANPTEWNHAFKLVWVKGHLIAVGDIGDITLTHYHAMPTARRSLEWLATSWADYLLGKSGQKQEIDVDRTIDTVRGWRDQEHDREHRKQLSLLLDELMHCDHDEVPRTLYESGLTSDFYGSYVWTHSRLVQVEMMKVAAKAWLASQVAEAA